MIRILIVEDEKPIFDLIRMSLSEAEYLCNCAFDGMTASEMIDKNKYDLILLDVLLPEVDGYELMAYIQPLGIPVIFLTAKAAVNDRVKGLKLGADDYLIKPIHIGELTVDTDSRTVKRDSALIPLTKKEFDLLVFFIRNKNIALFRDTIYEKIWGSGYMSDIRTLDLHVQRLRKKLGGSIQ